MIWFVRFLFVLAWLVVLDMIYGAVGLILCRYDYVKYPRLHRIGLRCLAMCETFGKQRLPAVCHLDCPNTQCGNWTCPRYHEK